MAKQIDVHEEITNRIIEAIERGATGDWSSLQSPSFRPRRPAT